VTRCGMMLSPTCHSLMIWGCEEAQIAALQHGDLPGRQRPPGMP
jgi:hypothetical protein